MSLEGSMARRYARALLQIGIETGRLRGLVSEIERVAAAVDESTELREVLQSPAVLKSQRKKVVDALAVKLAVSKLTRNTCLLLVDRGRAASLPAICRELKAMVDEYEGVLRAEVSSARPLDKAYVDRLTAALGKATGKKVQLTTKLDQDLIGGVVTRVGGVVYDGSIRTQLGRVREQILR